MTNDLAIAKNILSKYNQNHLLMFFDELSQNEKDILLTQIKNTNFEFIMKLYSNSKITKDIDYNSLSPLSHVEKDRLSSQTLNSYKSTGEQLLRSNSFAVVTMAGGQGTRLGYHAPKGTYTLRFSLFTKSLFEIICDDLKKTNNKYNVILPWYIMTSEDNDVATRNYFKLNNYFYYPKEKIHFFKQDQLPLINTEGKIILQEPFLIKNASCGNGNVFKSLLKSGALDNMRKNGIKWISFGGIDNILLKNADPVFLGMAIDGNYEIASKTIFKKEPLENTAVYCRKNNIISILDYIDINLELSEKKDENGIYLYREANMLSHLMTIDAVYKSTSFELPFHRAFKKNTFVNEEGMKQVPDSPNSFKFENFIFDAFSYFDDMLLLRVNPDEEFAPIKSFTGIYNPDTAMDKYEKYFRIPQHIL